jgi:type II secretory pathway pseudopilin PulG
MASSEIIARLKRRTRAFSLAELMITLAMISILGGLVVSSLSSIQERSMARQQLEVARGSLYEWRDKSRNAHMIGCINTTDDGAGEYTVTFKMIDSSDCTTNPPAVPGSAASFKLTGVQTISTQHIDSAGNVLASVADRWQGSFTVDGTPGGFSGLLTGLQPRSRYSTASLVELASGTCTISLASGMMIEQDSSGGIHVYTSQS